MSALAPPPPLPMSAMAPPVAEPHGSGGRSDRGFVSTLGRDDPVDIDDDDDNPLAMKFTYRDVDDYEPVDYETTCPGLSFTKEQEEEITLKWIERWCDLWAQFSDSWDVIQSQAGESSPLPPRPLKVLPETTDSCVTRGYCYHREYMTNDTSQTKSALGSPVPEQMMQVFSMRLSSNKSQSYPLSIYGIFAVRDDLEPLRNYVFNRSRENPIMIRQDLQALPLCSPCRGMYVLDHALLEVDLWVKKEGDGATDEQLLSVYVEVSTRSNFDVMLTGRIHGEDCSLDVDYMYLAKGVEAVIQVFTGVDSPHHVRFILPAVVLVKRL